MTDTARPPREDDAIDGFVDDAVRRMTAVDRLEARSRARVLARLDESDHAPVLVPRATVRRVAPWATAAVAASLAAALFFLSTGTTRVIESPPAPAAPAQAEHRADIALPGMTPAPSATVADRHVRATAVARPSMRSRRTPPAMVREDRLASFLRAVQQLPTEVWERQDAAGPPVVSELAAPPDAGIAPIAITELPASAWPEAQPVTSPGEPR